YWSTKPETRVNYFVIQRRVSSENQFSDIDTLASQVPNGGVSLVVLNYNRYDHNEYGGLSFYRLKTVNFDNSVAYSNIVVVANKAKSPVVTLWPNPTPNKFFIGISGLNNFRTIMIWDAVGQKMRQEEIAGRSIIAMDGLPAGSYIVGILTSDGTIVETKKLIVTGQ
ncbi:MAG TPA: T9SS type A sorting domain-containing protein, partial [Chitinophagaceae bacterium]|nr:T9SS type A sorting domain-containing protein [Chitinophagaceae bacterium]